MTALATPRRVVGALFVAFAAPVVMAAIAHSATIRPLTPEQQTYIAAQVEAQFGAFEKIVVRRINCCGGNRFPMVQVLTNPRVLPDERGFYTILDDDHSREPCVIFGVVLRDHAGMPVGTWPAGVCAE